MEKSATLLDQCAKQKKTRLQKTLKCAIEISGTALFSGQQVKIRILPAEASSGIRFKRMDLEGEPEIPASVLHAGAPFRFTLLKCGEATVQTVEHLLSALSASDVDNALIELTGPELPIGDGSSQFFIEEIEKAGVEELAEERDIMEIRHPIAYSEGETTLVALPSDEFKISYTLHYPKSELIGSQYFHYKKDYATYKNEIAPCRTFSEYEEVAPLIEKGLIRGGALETALVIKDGKVINPDGARFPDEMVRHKVLDLIGDLSLVGIPFLGHIVAVRTGHRANIELAKEIYYHLTEKKT